MKNGDSEKEARRLSEAWHMLGLETRVFLRRDGAALALEQAGLLLRFDEIHSLRDELIAQLAEGKAGAQGFAAYLGAYPYLRRMTERVDDWSTGQAKLNLKPGNTRSDDMAVQMTVEKIA